MTTSEILKNIWDKWVFMYGYCKSDAWDTRYFLNIYNQHVNINPFTHINYATISDLICAKALT
jgi:hypothetical protein